MRIPSTAETTWKRLKIQCMRGKWELNLKASYLGPKAISNLFPSCIFMLNREYLLVFCLINTLLSQSKKSHFSSQVHFSLGWRYCGHETTLSVAKEEDESKFPTQSCKDYYNCICQFSLKAFKIQEMGMMGLKGFPATSGLLKPDAFRT